MPFLEPGKSSFAVSVARTVEHEHRIGLSLKGLILAKNRFAKMDVERTMSVLSTPSLG